MAPVVVPVTNIPTNAIPITPSSTTVPPSLITRAQKFVEDNKALVLGAAVLAAGAGGYYFYSSRNDGPPGSKRLSKKKKTVSGGESGNETSSEDEKNDNTAGVPGVPTADTKSKKKRRKAKAKKPAAEPLLEERTPEEVEAFLSKQKTEKKQAEQEKETGSEKAKSKQTDATLVTEDQDVPSYLEGIPKTDAELAALPSSERKTLAITLKNRGNKLYSTKKYEDAIGCYTKALQVSEKPEAVFYSNRAACYQNQSPPNYNKVIEDCDAALALDNGYVKALNRRASALEATGRDEESLRDFTATTIMERFQNDAASASVERVLKKISSKKTSEMLSSREPKLPSSTFVASYLGAFRPHAKPELPTLPADSPNTGNNTLSLAYDAQSAGDYTHALTLSNEAIEQGISEDWKIGQAEAHTMRGTYRFLLGDTDGAKADFERALDIKPDFIQALVKIASVHMEQGDVAGAFGDFEAAIRHNADDPDIYYHRGQLYFVSGEFQKAADDYEKSTSLDEEFIFSHVQHAVAQYKLEQTRESMVSFRKILKKFPGRAEPLNYYGELLLDQQRFEEAVEKFDQAIEFEKDKTPRNVLPFVNKALAIFQWKQDMLTAETLCKEALEIDSDCDVAVATLAQLSLQQGKIPEAIEYFEKSAKLARTEPEMSTAITYEHASRAQYAFLQNYPEMAERLGQLAQQV